MFGVESEGVEDCGGEVVGGDGGVLDVGPLRVAGSPDCSSLDAGPGEELSVTVCPVVAAAGGVELGGAAEFSSHDDEGLVEEATLGEVFEQGREGVVEGGSAVFVSQLLSAGELAIDATDIGGDAVIVPEVELAAFGVVEGPEEIDEADTGFDKPTGHEETLAVFVATVAVADGGGFLFEIECAADPIGGEEIVSLFEVGIGAGDGGSFEGRTSGRLIELCGEGTPLGETLRIESGGEFEGTEFQRGFGEGAFLFLIEGEGIVGSAKESRGLSFVRGGTGAEGARENDPRGEIS